MSEARPPKIAVLVHSRDTIESPYYLLNHLIDRWRRDGLVVTVIRGVGEPQPADVAILHVDLTVTPQAYIDFSQAFPVVVNSAVADISKRKISLDLVSAGDLYDGEVIVKSDLNYGGRRETALRDVFHRQASVRLPWGWSRRYSPDNYPIFVSPAAVPRRVWGDPRLVVERFLPEREGDYYCLRQWVFFGNREVSQRLFARSPIVKAANTVDREYDVPIPDSLRSRRSALGFDYGKFDYVIHNGQAHLLDVNRTPTSKADLTPRQATNMDELARGLESFLPAGEPATGSRASTAGD